jgi:hypothetical protein
MEARLPCGWKSMSTKWWNFYIRAEWSAGVRWFLIFETRPRASGLLDFFNCDLTEGREGNKGVGKGIFSQEFKAFRNWIGYGFHS